MSDTFWMLEAPDGRRVLAVSGDWAWLHTDAYSPRTFPMNFLRRVP